MKSKKNGRRGNSNRAFRPLFEAIEPRTLMSVSTAPTGLTPIEVRQAYGFNQITFTNTSGQTVTGDGAGETIAIVDPYNAKTVDADLDTFDQAFDFDNSGQTLYQEFGAANSFLTVDSLGKGESDSGWALEVALDVEWAHAIAPAAKIDLVEAASASTTDLLNAVKTAADLPGVAVVSMSWGGSEARNETTFDSTFTTPSGHTGVTFVAASGDDGAGAEWPAVSPNVLSVGGTSLNVSSNGTYIGESAWSDGGGGLSAVESEPSYQDSVNSTGLRSTPDVSYDANPNSGFSVYTSVKQSGQSGWFTVGGTSAGAPQWSALVAIADQGRNIAGESNLDGPSQTLPYLYEMSSSSFHDITSGSNGYRATSGYDLATGLGSPVANAVVSNLVTPPTTTTGGTGSGSSGSGSGSGTGTGSGSGNRGYQPPFHMPPKRFPNRFHAWDVADVEQTAPTTHNHLAMLNLVDQSVIATSAAHGGDAADNSVMISGSGLFDGSANRTMNSSLSMSDAVSHQMVAGIAPMAIDIADAGSTHLATPPASISHTFANGTPVAWATDSSESIFSTKSVAANVAALFSNTVATIGEDGLKASIMVLPLIAFWLYQSRLSKSRGINTLHWATMP